jgi:hypothetical protein
MSDNGWEQWSIHVRKELTRLSGCVESLEDTVSSLHTEIAVLRVKVAAVASLIGGSVGTGATLLFKYFFGG